jgi:hypothetical protein
MCVSTAHEHVCGGQPDGLGDYGLGVIDALALYADEITHNDRDFRGVIPEDKAPGVQRVVDDFRLPIVEEAWHVCAKRRGYVHTSGSSCEHCLLPWRVLFLAGRASSSVYARRPCLWSDVILSLIGRKPCNREAAFSLGGYLAGMERA